MENLYKKVLQIQAVHLKGLGIELPPTLKKELSEMNQGDVEEIESLLEESKDTINENHIISQPDNEVLGS